MHVWNRLHSCLQQLPQSALRQLLLWFGALKIKLNRIWIQYRNETLHACGTVMYNLSGRKLLLSKKYIITSEQTARFLGRRGVSWPNKWRCLAIMYSTIFGENHSISMQSSYTVPLLSHFPFYFGMGSEITDDLSSTLSSILFLMSHCLWLVSPVRCSPAVLHRPD